MVDPAFVPTDPKEGDRAPPFELPDADGELHTLDDLLDGPVVLYFYPADFTAFCTREACSFQDALSDFEAAGARVVGVSPDPPDKHAAFRSRHGITFQLLSDVDGQVAKAYGASGFTGTRRVTFVLDRQGVVVARIASPLPGPHIRKALASLREHAEGART